MYYQLHNKNYFKYIDIQFTMLIKEVSGEEIIDSRKERTIEVKIITDLGEFKASSPSGKSTGKHENAPYKKSLNDDIITLKKFSDYFSEDNISEFDELYKVEEIIKEKVGANTLFAFESAVLKAVAKEKKKQIWQIVAESINAKINRKNGKMPRLVGNCIGGGKHALNSATDKRPDFQEFLLIPETNSIIQAIGINKDAQVNAGMILKNVDENFKGNKNEEFAWLSSLNDKIVLEVLKDLKDNIYDERKLYLDEGIDIAASGFCARKKYQYMNPKLTRTVEEQFDYLSALIENFHLLYIEDPFHEEDFEAFAKLTKKFPKRLIVGDDLIVTNVKRLEKAIKMKAVNAIIVKPNQNGSLLEVKRVCLLAKKAGLKTVFSHRSGETPEPILADLAFGFQADFFKCGIAGKEREAKLNRLVEIEKGLK